MDSPVVPLITLVTRPLAGNPELHAAAVAELQERWVADSPEAAAALAQADAHPLRRRWRLALGIVTVVVSLPLLVGVAVSYFGDFLQIKDLGRMPPERDGQMTLAERLGKGLSPAQRLLLVGEPNARKDADRWRPLWDSAPEKPAYLAEYALAFLRTNHALSPEILAAAQRIDPDNGWFPALAAAGLADGVVKKGARTSEEKREGKALSWEILDEPRLREALLQLHAAATQPRFAGYRNELHQERARLLPPRVDLASQLMWLLHASRTDSGLLPFRALSEAIAAGAEQCAARQDAEGFEQILADWRWLVRMAAGDGEMLLDQMVARVLLTTPLANFRDAARVLGLEADAAIFATQEQREREERGRPASQRSNSDLARQRGSLLAGMALVTPSLIPSPPVLTAADLRPGRLVDHAVFDRFSAAGIWLVLGTAVASAISPFRGRAVIRALAARLLDLLRPSDWAWLLLGGVVAPVLWYLAITRLTPLSAREWSLGQSGFLLPICQKAALPLLLACLPLALAEWRLGLRGAGFGLETSRRWLGWWAAGAAALAIPALGAAACGLELGLPLLAAGLLGGPLCWLLAPEFRRAAWAKRHALRRATVARMAVPAWLCAMLLCALALPFHYAEERQWLGEDRLLEVPAEIPAMSRYEAQLVPLLRADTLARMAALPPAPAKK